MLYQFETKIVWNDIAQFLFVFDEKIIKQYFFMNTDKKIYIFNQLDIWSQ